MVTPARFRRPPDVSPPVKLPRNSLRLRILPITILFPPVWALFPSMSKKTGFWGGGGGGGGGAPNNPPKPIWPTRVLWLRHDSGDSPSAFARSVPPNHPCILLPDDCVAVGCKHPRASGRECIGAHRQGGPRRHRAHSPAGRAALELSQSRSPRLRDVSSAASRSAA